MATFGNDLRLMAEVIITGDKVGANREFWKKLAHDEALFAKVVAVVNNGHAQHEQPVQPIPVPIVSNLSWAQAMEKAYALLGLKDEYAKFLKESGGLQEMSGHWVLAMVNGISCNKLVTAIRQAGSDLWSYADDLDGAMKEHDRDPNKTGSYLVAFKVTVEADSENANKSANALQKVKHQGITLTERLLLELVYFLMTGGEHLDIDNVTLCTGSRYRDGDVPYVHWNSGYRKVSVHWYDSGSSDHSARSRSAVSISV